MKKVFLVCTGLGNVKRGYESFTQECYDHLKNAQAFQLYLIKGGGQAATKFEKVIPNISRQSKLAIRLSKLLKKEPYYIEQCSFFINLIPSIIKHKPTVIYYSDFVLGTFLFHLRNWFQFKYKLLFSNGAPNGPPFSRCDKVQQLLPLYLEQCKEAGESMHKFILLPYALNINNNVKAINTELLRRELGLPVDKKIIISVGAINKHHKRMNYVVQEFAKFDCNNYFLLLLGNMNAESELIINEANSLLTHNSFAIKEVEGPLVMKYLMASNYFVLASLQEGLPRVLIEALSAGLLPIVHDYAVTRETLLNEYGVFTNLQISGNLQKAIAEASQTNYTASQLRTVAYNNYSWDKLSVQYSKMIQALAN